VIIGWKANDTARAETSGMSEGPPLDNPWDGRKRFRPHNETRVSRVVFQAGSHRRHSAEGKTTTSGQAKRTISQRQISRTVRSRVARPSCSAN
jgi:hypothetical protein